ncbi:hypothetical protein Vretimale_17987 [Volvox reticuliferus]|uniref:Uncharacterized protein n=1 Tax=Volvox reticuliferus TaxID=1737510 RepID=A0A8J4LYY4_9CHLO|nr:hypothetical protein Vretimale_17987 [Volvox reticuliferus]
MGEEADTARAPADAVGSGGGGSVTLLLAVADDRKACVSPKAGGSSKSMLPLGAAATFTKPSDRIGAAAAALTGSCGAWATAGGFVGGAGLRMGRGASAPGRALTMTKPRALTSSSGQSMTPVSRAVHVIAHAQQAAGRNISNQQTGMAWR